MLGHRISLIQKNEYIHAFIQTHTHTHTINTHTNSLSRKARPVPGELNKNIGTQASPGSAALRQHIPTNDTHTTRNHQKYRNAYTYSHIRTHIYSYTLVPHTMIRRSTHTLVLQTETHTHTHTHTNTPTHKLSLYLSHAHASTHPCTRTRMHSHRHRHRHTHDATALC